MADNNTLPSLVEFSENIADAEAPEPLPAGEYRGTIQSCEVKLSQKGTKYGSARILIPADQFPADFDASQYPDGMTLSYNLIGLEDNRIARYRLRQWCEAIGAPATKQIDVNDWVGLDANFRLDVETYEGVKRNNIRGVSRA